MRLSFYLNNFSNNQPMTVFLIMISDIHIDNDVFLTTKKFSCVCFSSNVSAYESNLYIDSAMNIIGPSTYVLDFKIS